MPTPARRPTLVDIAAAAGVSRATASNAFNRPGRLSAATREAILAIAESLGYAGPDPAAAGLRRGRTGAVGVVIPERLTYAFSDPASLLILDGLAEVLSSVNSSLLLLAGNGTGGGPPPETVMSAAVDAFVCYCIARDDPALDVLRRRRLPMVFIDESPLRGTFAVDLDEETGSRQLTDHLVGLGHRRFGVVTLECRSDGRGGPLSAERRATITYSVTKRRLEAVLDALGSAGIRADDVPVYEAPHNISSEGGAAASWLLDHDVPPTAIIVQSDVLAIGALDEARRRGLDVPGDVSIAGFDDIDAASRTFPPLTTVRQPLRERGRLAGELLLAALEGKRSRRVRLPSELIVRTSTGPPSRRRVTSASRTTSLGGPASVIA
jgi:DNA-binding LacI/PurR family transcriptional regulator